jgi:hypothetical protein
MSELSPEQKARKQILNELNMLGVEEVLDAPMLHISRQTFTNVLTRIELFKMVREVQGSIVECGVYKANNLMTFFHMSNIYEPFNFNRKIVGFDSFEGFPSTSDFDPTAIVGHLSDTNFTRITELIKAQEINKALPNMNKIQLVKGDAHETIVKYKNENPHLIVALLYLDFDLYEPTKIALQELLPLVPKGGIVAFDELNQFRWAGETKALNEVLGISNVELKKFDFDPHVSYFRKY